MANARASALAERRSSYSGPYGDRRTILAPKSTGLSTIAKQSASNETQLTIDKYNNGEISNEQMKTFLVGQLNSPYVSDSDKREITSRLADFDALIQKDKLESIYKNTSKGSMERMQAAQALSQFYQDRAATMVEGTPAQSQALENAGNWQATVQSIQTDINKQQRDNLETMLTQKINTLPTSSSQRSSAQVNMYNQLASLAQQQGDQQAANEYIAAAQQAKTYADQYAEAEQAKQTKEDIKKYIADRNLEISKLTNNSAEELKAKASLAYDLASKYQDLGDTVNASIFMAKYNDALEKFNKKSTSEKNAAAAKDSYDKMSEYSNQIRLAQEMYVNGQDPAGNPYTEKEYKEDLLDAVTTWKSSLENLYTTASEMNPSEKISWKGKMRNVGDVIDEIQNEYQKITGLDSAIQSGTVKLKELPVSEQIGKNMPRFELIDSQNLSEQDQALLAEDETGILHSGEMGKTEVGKDEYEEAKLMGTGDEYTRDSKTGKYYKYTGINFTVADPITGQTYVQQAPEPGKKLQSYAQIREEATKLGYKPGERIDYSPEKQQVIDLEGRAAMTQEQALKSQEKAKKIQEVQAQEKQPTTGVQIKSPFREGAIVNQAPTPFIAGKINENIIQPAVSKVQAAVAPAVKQVEQAVAPQLATAIKAVSPITQPIIKAASTPTGTFAPSANIREMVSTPTGQFKPVVDIGSKVLEAAKPVAQAAQTAIKPIQQAVSTSTGQYKPSAMIVNKAIEVAKPAVQKIGSTIKSGFNWLKNKFF